MKLNILIVTFLRKRGKNVISKHIKEKSITGHFFAHWLHDIIYSNSKQNEI